MKPTFWYVANWKMNLSFNQASDFARKHQVALSGYASDTTHIAICPAATDIFAVKRLLDPSPIKIGAQDCSSEKKGNFTGDVSAQSIKEAGASLCIIGHAERRLHHQETDAIIAQKLARLLENQIVPLICIGEDKAMYEKKLTHSVLKNQLDPLIALLRSCSIATEVLIAYEPVWAIGSGMVPDNAYLAGVFAWLADTLTKSLPELKISLLYGGSVSEHSVQMLRTIPHLNGFLIGGASTLFESFEKIIRLSNRSDS